MNLYQKWLAVSIVATLVGCGVPNGIRNIEFGSDVQIQAQVVPFDQILAPDFLTYKQGALVVANSRSDTILHLYNAPELSYRGSGVRKGRGPNEAPSFVMFCASPSKSLYLTGVGSFASIRKVDVSAPDSIRFLEDYEIGKTEELNYLNLINDSILVYFSLNELKIKKYDLKNHKELGEIALEKESHNESFFYSNRGRMACTDSLIVYVYIFKKQIDLYDLHTMKRVLRISDGKEYPAPDPSLFGDIEQHSQGVYAGKEHFYVLVGEPNSPIPYDNTKLEVYDYQGNSVVRYAFDVGPGLFAVDEEHGCVYATNTQREGCWLRYRLPQ